MTEYEATLPPEARRALRQSSPGDRVPKELAEQGMKAIQGAARQRATEFARLEALLEQVVVGQAQERALLQEIIGLLRGRT
jgi:hypothetical protein